MRLFYNSILWFCVLVCVSCHEKNEEIIFPPEPEPEEEPEIVVDSDFTENERYLTLWDITKRVPENEDTERNLYSAEYMLEVAGVSYSVTDSWNEELENSSLILLSSPVSDNTFLPEEVEKLEAWLQAGGVLVAPAVTGIGEAVSRLFGISGAVRSKSRYELNFIDSQKELIYIDEPEEKNINFGKHGGECIYTYGYNVTDGEMLAYFETGEAGMVRNTIGNGRTYTFGVKWRDVIQRSQLNKDFGASRAYSNGFECMADVFPLILRSIHVINKPVCVWKHTIPDGKLSVLIPTHDCDSRTAYDEMHYMSDYERSLKLSAHYFLTTHYYHDPSYLSAFYDQTSIKASQALIKNGHTVGSHSIGHFPDFSKTELFPLREVTKDEYARTATHNMVTDVTSGGSTWAEIVLSKQIIEGDLGNKVCSFRSGHLCMNKNIPEAMRMGGYSFSSCYSAGDVLTCFPFRERIGNDWSGTFNGVLQIPLHISDVFSGDGKMDENNWQDKPEIWLTSLDKLAGNYAPCVLLIHPNRKWKMESQKMLVDNLDRNKIGLCNFEAYGEFWNTRREFDFEYCYIPKKQKIVIRTERKLLDENPNISFGIETTQAEIKEAVLVDKQNIGIKLKLQQIAENRMLASRR